MPKVNLEVGGETFSTNETGTCINCETKGPIFLHKFCPECYSLVIELAKDKIIKQQFNDEKQK